GRRLRAPGGRDDGDELVAAALARGAPDAGAARPGRPGPDAGEPRAPGALAARAEPSGPAARRFGAAGLRGPHPVRYGPGARHRDRDREESVLASAGDAA